MMLDVEPHIDVLVSPLRRIIRADALRLGVAEGPGFIALEKMAGHVPHEAIVQVRAPLADGEPEAHDRVSVRPGDALRRPDRSAVYEARRDLGALRHRENRHGTLRTNGTEAAATEAPRAVQVLNRVTPTGTRIKKRILTDRRFGPMVCR